MWYVLEGYNDQLQRLAREKLNVVIADIQQPKELSGLAFPEEDLAKVMEQLEITETPQKISTDMTGIVFLKFAKKRQRTGEVDLASLNVRIGSWSGADILQRYFRDEAREKLLPIVKKDIEIYVPHGEKVSPRNDDIFRIFIYSSAKDEDGEMITLPNQIFGHDVENRSLAFNSYSPTGKTKNSILLIDEETDYAPAQIIGDNLFIHHDICHWGASDELNIFKEILNQAAQWLALSPEDQMIKQKRLAEERSRGRVIFKEWLKSSDLKQRFSNAISEVLLPAIKKDVVVRDMNGGLAALKKDARFHIYLFSSIKGNDRETIEAPEKMFDLKVNCRRALPPHGAREDSVVIMDEDSDYAIAEMFGNSNLFIHHHITCSESPQEVGIFKRLLAVVVEELAISPAEREKKKKQKFLDKQQLEAAQDEAERVKFAKLYPETRAQYIKACANRFVLVSEETTKIIFQTNQRLSELGAQIIALTKQNQFLEPTVAAMEAQLEVEKKACEEEFDKIIALPGVLGVAMLEKRTLSVFTDVIRIAHEGKTYFIGQFRINIAVSEEKFSLTFLNLHNWGQGPGFEPSAGFDANSQLNRHHPYIDAAGQAELGRLEAEIPQFLAKNKYSMVVKLLLQFLRTVNIEDFAGRGLKWWPAEKTKPVPAAEPTVRKKRAAAR